MNRDEDSVSLDGRIGYRLAGADAPLPGDDGYLPERDRFRYGPLPAYADHAPAWLAITVVDHDGGSRWSLVAKGSPLSATEVVVAVEGRETERFSRAALGALALPMSRPGVGAMSLPGHGASRWTVYLYLADGLPAGTVFRMWRYDALARLEALLLALAGLTLGLYLTGLLALGHSGPRPLPAAHRSASAYMSLAILILLARLLGAGAIGLRETGPGFLAANALAMAALTAGAIAVVAARSDRPGAELRLGLAVAGPSAILATGFAVLARLPAEALPRLAAAPFAATAALYALRGAFALGKKGSLRNAVGLASWTLPALGAAVTAAAAFRSPDTSSMPDAGWWLFPAAAAIHALAQALVISVGSVKAHRVEAAKLTEAVKRLEAGARSQFDFVYRLAESIKRPLYGMLASLGQGPENAIARAECQRLLALASNIQHYVRAEAREDVLVSEPFNLAAVIDAVVNAARYLGEGKKLSWDLSIPIIEMRNDPKAVQHALYTVVSRAVRSPGCGAVSIRAASDTHLVTVEIRENGRMPEELGNAIHSRQIDPVYRDLDGRLIDLDATSSLTTRLGGSFSYARDGGFNRYSFVFPRSMSWPPREKEPLAERESAGTAGLAAGPALGLDGERGARGGPGSVMVVDDEPVSLFNLKRRLEGAGWRVVALVSAQAALARLAADERFELLLIDSSLADMPAEEFCAAVRARFGRESLPIIVLVDSGFPEEIERAFSWGANDYLIRPAGGPELIARVKTHVDLASSVRRELAQRDRMAEEDKFKTLGWLTAGVAHEVNTPNNAALRNVPMLKEIWSELAEPLERLNASEGGFSIRGFGFDDLRREIPEMLNDLYMGSLHIKKIVEDLKDYARGPSDSGHALMDANQAVEYAARLLRHMIAVSTHHFSASLRRDLPPVKADRLKLAQAVVNVLENALQALPSPERAVSLETYAEAPDGAGRSWVCIRVRDEGAGMDERTLASVFDPFFTTKRERGGSGLGMPVAVGIMREMGGLIEIQSAPGVGTTATLRIPAAVAGGEKA